MTDPGGTVSGAGEAVRRGRPAVAMSESWTDTYPAYARLRRRRVRQPGALVGPDAPAGLRRRAERARLDADLQGRDRRRQRADRRRRLLPAGARDDLRRDRRPLRPRRAGRPGHGGGRAPASWRAGSGSAGRRTSTRSRPASRSRPTPATTPTIVREKAILRRLVDAGTKIAQMGYAGEGDVDATVDVGAAGDLRDRREAAAGGLRAAVRDHGGHPRRDRGDLEQRRHHRWRADRVRRPRRADERLLRRPDDHRRRAPRGRQVHAGARLLSLRVDPQQPDQRDLQPGDVAAARSPCGCSRRRRRSR